MHLNELSLIDYVDKIKAKKLSAEEGARYFIDRIKKDERNAVLEVFEKSALVRAIEIDKRIKEGKKPGRLAGAPIIIKDNILYKDHIVSAASKMLESFVAPFSATVVEKLLSEDAIILGRSNMDEFSMGGSGEKSAFGPTHNAHRMGYISGGSSGGSAVAVAAGLCVASLGTDTGGSVRSPASYNGIFGIKPTYGTVSRSGVIAYASSLEQAGPFCKTAEDTRLMLDVIRGKDIMDATSIDMQKPSRKADIKKLKIGYVKEVWQHKDKIADFDKYQKLFDFYKKHGAEIKEISIKNLDLVLPAYYIIATAEATSNLARFDGVKYASAAKYPQSLNDLYKRTRSEFFGKEVKRRIMLGNFVLSSGFYDAYYGKAKTVQAAITKEFEKAFEEVDLMLMPIMLSDAYKIGEKGAKDPVEMYLEDIFTITANIIGAPALAIPFEKGRNGLPIGFQLLAAHFNEEALFEAAKLFKEGTKC